MPLKGQERQTEGYDEFCAKQRQRATSHLAAFLAANPNYALGQDEPQWLKGTHLVAFGSHCGQPAVFKYYDGDPRKEHERRTLALYQPTGLVPRILGETDVMLAMERLPGSTILELEEDLDAGRRDELHSDLGRATAKIVELRPGSEEATNGRASSRAWDGPDFYNTPFGALSADLYRQADTAMLFDTTLARGAKVLSDGMVPHKEALAESLRRLQQHRDAILSFPSFVQTDDFHMNNIMAEGSRVTGFIDLENSCSGNEPLLLGVALTSLCQRTGRWSAFRRGYEKARGSSQDGQLFHLARIAAPFSAWIRFMFYWSTDDQPGWTKFGDFRSWAVRDIMAAVASAESVGR